MSLWAPVKKLVKVTTQVSLSERRESAVAVLRNRRRVTSGQATIVESEVSA